MTPVAIELEEVQGYKHFDIRLSKKKAELWCLPGLEDSALYDAIWELEMCK